MVMNEKDKIDFENAKTCYLCKKTFTSNDKKRRGHDHKTGKNIVELTIINVIYFIKGHNIYQ